MTGVNCFSSAAAAVNAQPTARASGKSRSPTIDMNSPGVFFSVARAFIGSRSGERSLYHRSTVESGEPFGAYFYYRGGAPGGGAPGGGPGGGVGVCEWSVSSAHLSGAYGTSATPMVSEPVYSPVKITGSVAV